MNNFIINKQRGVTLIELMISMVITSVLMLGVVGVYVTSKRGYAMQDGLARQQENARFSLDILTHDIRMAGYPKESIAEPIVVATTSDGGGANSDTLTLQFESPTDCLNQAAPGGVAVNRYFIDNNSNLVCQGNGSADIDVLADGVENMQILYGVDTDSTPDGQANKYINWSVVTVAEREQIVSIRIGLLTSTPTEAASTQKVSIHQILDQQITTDDKRFHRNYSNTIVLRNRLL